MMTDLVERPRVAHVMPWSAVGGTELGAARIATAIEQRYESIAFCVPNSSQVQRLFVDIGCEVAEYKPIEPQLRRIPRFAAASLALAREFLRHRISIVHCADLLAGYHAATAGWLAGVPVVCHVRCAFEHVEWRLNWSLRNINRFVFVSKHTWRVFGYPVGTDRGTVIYDGLPLDARSGEPAPVARIRRELRIPTDAKVVGMVARLAPAKDYPTLILAATRIAAERDDVRFLIVGDHSSTSDYREHYGYVQALIADAGLSGRFVFTGHRSDVAELIDAMDVFVLSTHTEGLPLVVIEAMARRKPVIATAVGGIPELVQHERTGLLHNHQDYEAFATQISHLLNDQVYARKLGTAAARHVQTAYCSERFSKEMIGLYRDLLDAPKASTFPKAHDATAPNPGVLG